MKDTRAIMGMPISIEVRGEGAREAMEAAFAYFIGVDERFSTYKDTSEISRINRGELSEAQWSDEMREVFTIAKATRAQSDGYFDIRRPDGSIDPSGVVKSWAIKNAAEIITKAGCTDFLIDAGGDIAMSGTDLNGDHWSVGIRNPFKRDEIVKVMYPKGFGVATSGSYIRGAHIYDPHDPKRPLDEIVSITVVGPDVLEADRFATAAFAMGPRGIRFIEKMPDLEGYMIDKNGIATMTSGFEFFTASTS